jgi:hypothetical protein
LLVTISIIGILAALSLGAVSIARESARVSATRATIAKLHAIIMQRYESYMTRRLPLGLLVYPAGNARAGQPLSPHDAAQDRLAAIRDLMRMEMPDRGLDVPPPVDSNDNSIGSASWQGDVPIRLPNSNAFVPVPALALLYYNRLTSPGPSNADTNIPAALLYMIVSMGSPEAMEQFGPSEIGDPDHDGYPKFLDGWGQPIFFLRWAPGFSVPTQYSDIQLGNPVTDHDPFDPSNVEQAAFKLVPLIYSAGKSGGITNTYGLQLQKNYGFGNSANGSPAGMMFTNTGAPTFLKIGPPVLPNQTGFITNHHLEAR